MSNHENSRKNTDGDETMFFQTSDSGRSDSYDTQQIDAEQVRRQAGQTSGQNSYSRSRYPQNGQPQNGYPQNGHPQNGHPQNGYPQNGYSQNGYPQNGYSQNGYSQNGYPQNGYSQNGYSQNGYSQNGYRQSGGGQQSYPPRQGQPVLRNQQGGYRQPEMRQQPKRTAPPQGHSSASSRPPSQRQPQRPQSRQPERTRQAHQRKPRRSLLGRIIRFVLTLVVVLFLLYSAIALIGILAMDRVETGNRSVTTGSLGASYVKTVLVIGTDARDPEQERGRSDSMILVSLNAETKEIYMTSFLRDVYVEIPGNGSGKLNAAYSYGGPELLMDTLEYNYDIQIDDYVMITFSACAKMIDAVGGVELTISDEEAQAVNEILISEVNEIMGDQREDDLLDSGGTLTLDGKQALSYSRIRYVGNADFERTERQRTVMQQVMEKVKKNPLRLASVCVSALPEMRTNLSIGSLYGYAVTVPVKLLVYDTQQQRVPADGTFSNGTIDGESVLQADFSAARQQLSTTVFAGAAE